MRAARQVLWLQFHAHALHREEVFLLHDLVSFELLPVVVRSPAARRLPEHRLGDGARLISGCNPHRLLGLEVGESGGDFTVIQVLERALAETAPRHQAERVGGAAVNLNERHQPFPVLRRVVDAQFLQSQHGHAHAQHLPGTHVSVILCGQRKIFVQCFHETTG